MARGVGLISQGVFFELGFGAFEEGNLVFSKKLTIIMAEYWISLVLTGYFWNHSPGLSIAGMMRGIKSWI